MATPEENLFSYKYEYLRTSRGESNNNNNYNNNIIIIVIIIIIIIVIMPATTHQAFVGTRRNRSAL